MEVEGRDLATPERQAGLWQALKKRVAEIRHPEVQNAYRRAVERRFEAAFGYNPLTGRRVWSGSRQGAVAQSARRGGRPVSGGLGVRRPPEVLRHRQEQALLAAVINHPEILSEHAEELPGLDLVNKDLRRLCRTLVDLAAHSQDLDTGALKRHLCEQGFAKVLEGLLARQVQSLCPFVKSDFPLDEARVNWAHLVAQHRGRRISAEREQAIRRLADDPTEKNLARLQAHQRSAEGDEEIGIAFDLLETAGSDEPS
jgi:DNA primase